MKTCPHCGNEADASVCPNCGHSSGPYPWLEMILLVLLGLPCLLVGSCGTIALLAGPATFPIALPAMIIGLGGFYGLSRLYERGLRRHKGRPKEENGDQR